MRFCKADPCYNTHSEDYPAKNIILQITALLILLLCTLNNERREHQTWKDRDCNKVHETKHPCVLHVHSLNFKESHNPLFYLNWIHYETGICKAREEGQSIPCFQSPLSKSLGSERKDMSSFWIAILNISIFISTFRIRT